MTEPTSVRDMVWVQRQKVESDICVSRVDSGGEPREGGLSSTSTHVRARLGHDDVVVFERSTYYRDRDEHGWWNMRVEDKRGTTLTFDQFRKSEWWAPYLDKVKGCNCDSSWMDSIQVSRDEQHVEVELSIPEERDVWWCSAPVPTGDMIPCEVSIDLGGDLYLKFGDDVANAHIAQFVKAMKLIDRMERAGVTIDDDGTITMKPKSDGDGRA